MVISGAMTLTVYQAPREYEADLKRELDFNKVQVFRELGPLFFTHAPAQAVAWSEWTWQNAELVNVPSIGAAAKELKARTRFWLPVSVAEHRRLALIAESLSVFRPREIIFTEAIRNPDFGACALLNKEELLLATSFNPAVPLGHFNFQQNKAAPSRAYLKLWEALTRLGKIPKQNEKCLDLGSSPGGWTWVLAKLGCQVLSVDRSELTPELMRDPLVKFESGDAFRYRPKQVGSLDWLVSDVICYPEKLYGFVEEWINSGQCKNFVCTIKFQGDSDPAWIARFRALGGEVVHLSHNKHEVTWIAALDS